MLPFSGVLFCSDLDGTLTQEGDVISPANVEAILRFQRLGGRFTVATGRFPDFIRPFCEKHPGLVNAPLVSVNGAVVYDLAEDRALCVRPLRAEILPVLAFAYHQPGLVCIHMHQLSSSWEWAEDEASLARIQSEAVLKIVTVWRDAATAESVQKELVRRFGRDFDILRSWPMGVELLDPRGGKGNGVDFLRQTLPDVRLVVAAGDFENDIPMFEHCDLSFTPANALPSVKQAAKYPLEKSNQEDFIAAALARLESLAAGKENP